jgi:hypothetical protein
VSPIYNQPSGMVGLALVKTSGASYLKINCPVEFTMFKVGEPLVRHTCVFLVFFS